MHTLTKLALIAIIAFLGTACEEEVELTKPVVTLSVDNPSPTTTQIVRFTVTGSAENYVLFSGLTDQNGNPKLKRYTAGDLRVNGGQVEARYNYGQDRDGGAGTYQAYVVATNVDGFRGEVVTTVSDTLLIEVQ